MTTLIGDEQVDEVRWDVVVVGVGYRHLLNQVAYLDTGNRVIVSKRWSLWMWNRFSTLWIHTFFESKDRVGVHGDIEAVLIVGVEGGQLVQSCAYNNGNRVVLGSSSHHVRSWNGNQASIGKDYAQDSKREILVSITVSQETRQCARKTKIQVGPYQRGFQEWPCWHATWRQRRQSQGLR